MFRFRYLLRIRFYTITTILLLFLCLQAVPHTVLSAPSPPQQSELEDLGFIKNLFHDKIYNFAKQEGVAFQGKYPNSPLIPDVLFILAQINAIEGDFKLALRHHTEIISRFPDSPLVEDALYFIGFLKLQLNQQEGMIDLDHLLSRFPQSAYRPKIGFLKGEQAFQAKNWSLAEKHYKAVLESEKIDDELRLKTQHQLAWIYYFSGNILHAKSLFFELLDGPLVVPEKAKIAFQLGVESHKEGRYRNAITWFERQLKEWPDPGIEPRSQFWIAECLYLEFKRAPDSVTDQEKERAIALFDGNLKRKDPVSPLLSRYHRGWLHVSLNRPQQAEADFSWLQENSREYAADLEITAVRARYFESANNLKAANSVYENALGYQKDKEIRLMLQVGMIRNYNALKDCAAVLKWKAQTDLSSESKDAPEILYYAGRCHFIQKQWQQAANDFKKIPLNSPYARVIFPDYLEVLKRLRDFKGGISYLESVMPIQTFGGREKILLLEIDFCLTFEQWGQGVDLMLAVEKEFKARARDPWFLLNIARTSDQVYDAYPNKKHPMHQNSLKEQKFYANLALSHYQTAYQLLPGKEKETRLSVLDILIVRYKALGNHKKVVAFYRQALDLITDRQKRAEVQLIIASILLKDLHQTQNALQELHQLHKQGHSDTHFEASSLLAEIYVKENKQVQAIKILEDLAEQPIQNTRWFTATHFRLAELYQAAERWQKAVDHYEEVIKDNKVPDLVEQAKIRAGKIKIYLEQKG